MRRTPLTHGINIGNYQIIIRLAGLKTISETFPTKTLAEKFVREVEGDIQLQQKLGRTFDNKITLPEVIDLYMEQYAGRDHSTHQRLTWWCNWFGKKTMTQIDEFMVDDACCHSAKKAWLMLL